MSAGNQRPDTRSRADQHRDLLETWAAWWNNVGRRYYAFHVLPPITATGEALACSICAGEREDARCQVCGRDMKETP